MNVPTYLSQEGFEERRKGVHFSREINTLFEATMNPKLWNVTINEFTYKNIRAEDVPVVVEAIHTYEGTSLVVLIYNLQYDVKAKTLLPIKEDI